MTSQLFDAFFLSEVIGISDQPFAIGNSDGTFVYCNDAFCELTGYSKKEFTNINWVVGLTPHKWRKEEAKVFGELRRTGLPQRHQKEYIKKDGKIIQIDFLLHQILDPRVNVLYYVFFVIDVSLRKQESLLMQNQLNSEIIGTEDNSLKNIIEGFCWANIKDVLERTQAKEELIELEKKSKKMAKEMQRLEGLNILGQIAGGLGHEVRNPLTTIRGFLQMLSSKENYQEDIEYFKLMIDELDRANGIITEFLSLGKSSENDNLSNANLNFILNSLQPLLIADAIKYDKNVILKLQDIPDLLVYEKEIRQLVYNLVRNALEAMQTGGKATIETYVQDSYIILAVKDEGNGIPSDIFKKLGTPFLTTKEEGTGLGLSICYNIAHKHNAKIEVESSLQGTIFYVKFKMPEE